VTKVLYFDSRWFGNNGIGKYSTELSRITIPGQVVFATGSHPTRLREMCRPLFNIGKTDISYSPGYIARPFLRFQVITIHDLILLEPKIGTYFQRMYFNLFLKPRIRQRRIRVITVSQYSRNKIADWAEISAQSIDVIPNGISAEILKAGESLDALPRGRSLLFLGSLKPHKRFDLFVKAVNLLEESYSIILVGSNLNGDEISNKHSVKLLQNIDEVDLAKAYLESNVVVITSSFEGFCMPVLEGAFLGCKILHLGVLPTVKEILGDASFSTFGSLKPEDIAREISTATYASNKLAELDRRELAEKYSWNKSRRMLIQLAGLSQDEISIPEEIPNEK
jgi:glycosyltransferase involved in cell wall biosynthesis